MVRALLAVVRRRVSRQPPLGYPHPKPPDTARPPAGDLHPTLGLPGNWALDFMAPGGTPVLAPQDATVTRLSGHDPAEGVIDGSVFGRSVYLTTSGGVVYFATHLGNVAVKLGQHVKLGALVGHVGTWPHDPPRSHTHLGVTHPAGKTAAVARILAVSRAPRASGL